MVEAFVLQPPSPIPCPRPDQISHPDVSPFVVLGDEQIKGVVTSKQDPTQLSLLLLPLQLSKGLGYCFHLYFKSERNYNPAMEGTSF